MSFADLKRARWLCRHREAAKAAGHNITVPLTLGRTDASVKQTDVESFAVLVSKADGSKLLPATR